MSWFNKLKIKTAELDFPFSLAGMAGLLRAIRQHRDVPGQQYLIQGPEVADLQILRSSTPETVRSLSTMISYLNYAFQKMADSLETEKSYRNRDPDEIQFREADTEPDQQEMEYEVEQLVDMYVSEYYFDNQDDMFSFLSELDDASLNMAYKEALAIKQMPDQIELNKWMGMFKQWATQVSNSGYVIHQEFIDDVIKAWTAGEEDPFLDAVVEFTREVMVGIIDYETTQTYGNRQLYNNLPQESIPPWIDEKKLKNSLSSDFNEELYKWYRDKNIDQLNTSAYESLSERRGEDLREFERELDHSLGEGVAISLADEWDVSDEEIISGEFDEDDHRFTMTVNILSDVVEAIGERSFLIEGAKEAISTGALMTASVVMMGNNDETLKFVFSHGLNSTRINPDLISDAIKQITEEGGDIPPVISSDENMKKLIEQIELQHKMLETGEQSVGQEDLQKMKEMGIANKPFPHAYKVERGTYPGSGYTNIKSLEPFRISVAPLQEKIPQKLLQDMSIHKVNQPMGQAPLGWIGGYADYQNKIMYVSEVQSDIMQRTVHMRDPEKMDKMRQSEISRLENEINNLNAPKNNISPKQKIKESIDRINMENQQSTDPKRITENKMKIDKLLMQYQNAPDIIPQYDVQGKRNQLEQQIEQLKSKHSRDFKSEHGYYKPYPQWHDYKSKVENTFKEWVPIFFNIAVREAKKRGFEKMRIISADSLLKMWAQFAGENTGQLFKRVYDQTAQWYKGQPVSANGYSWFEFNVPEAKSASKGKNMNWFKKNKHNQGWFKKASWFKSCQQIEWMTTMPDGRPVWQIHIDKFFETMKRKMPELQNDEFGYNDYSQNEGNREVFNFWLEEVPVELKMGNDLEPEFKQAVREYLVTKYDFDPYEHDIEDEEDNTPTVEDLESWWSS